MNVFYKSICGVFLAMLSLAMPDVTWSQATPSDATEETSAMQSSPPEPRTKEQPDRFERGLKRHGEVTGGNGRAVVEAISRTSPDFARYVIEYPYGDIFSRDGITDRDRELAIVAALMAMGFAAPELDVHIAAALNVGVSPTEICELVHITSVYAGFPAAIHGLRSTERVFENERDNDNPEARSVECDGSPQSASGTEDRYARGLRRLSEITQANGEAVVAGISETSPDFARYVVEYPYGDIFSREGISDRDRQFATVASLMALGWAKPELEVHMQGALNVGVSEDELKEIVILMSVYAGFPAAIHGHRALESVLAN